MDERRIVTWLALLATGAILMLVVMLSLPTPDVSPPQATPRPTSATFLPTDPPAASPSPVYRDHLILWETEEATVQAWARRIEREVNLAVYSQARQAAKTAVAEEVRYVFATRAAGSTGTPASSTAIP